MSTRADFLVEIGTEELPPKALKRLMESFANGVRDGLTKADLVYGAMQPYAAPRRLAVLVKDLVLAQPDKQVERRGPALTAAFKPDGTPTPAAEGFARSCGVAASALTTLKTDAGAWLVHRFEQPGQPAAKLLPGIVHAALGGLPIPKRMRWGSSTHEFVRPVHWLVMLLGKDVIDCEMLGQHAGRDTRGHRFHHPEKLKIATPAGYAPLLESEGFVLPDFTARRAAIEAQVQEVALQIGGRAVIDPDLLDEVCGMIEWPQAVAGQFEHKFLDVPAEALISAMKGHQKYFHVLDKNDNLMPHFITVANIRSRDIAQVRAGNERVIRPRLTDAAFFWNQDRKQKLHAQLQALGKVVFQNQLGTVADKAVRIGKLAAHIAGLWDADRDHATRAGLLAKCDLMTAMVGEFPELQGIMGRYYAIHDGEPVAVAVAIAEHYRPRFAGDAVPASVIGAAVAVADKLDTLIGIFGIGQIPTGDKDPFGLRRAALGVVRTLIETDRDLDLIATLRFAAESYGAVIKKPHDTAEAVFEFTLERLRAYYQDTGVRPDSFDAVHAVRPVSPRDFALRIQAVEEFRRLPEAESLAAANKRIRNILRQAEVTTAPAVNAALLKEPAEQTLHQQIEALRKATAPLIKQRRYTDAMRQFAALKAPVDAFFDAVMVMVDDTKLKNTRLGLLAGLADMLGEVAEIARLQGA
ncbi:MAG: glycine--tRNA ligase subunit beta [Pseudomonadota bacterium]